MLIRTRILLAYLIFIVILAVTAVSYFYFSNKQMKYYDITEKDVEAREIMKTASTIFAEQVRSYDYYVFLHEDTERFSFFEKKTLLADKMSAAEGLKVSGIGKLKKDIGEISGLFSTSFDMVKNSRREKAIEFSNAEILPRIDKISAVLHEMVEGTEEKLQLSREIAVSYKEKATRISVMLFALGILLMSLVSMGMYRTIMMPLEKIEKAATIIGRGNLDYKVKIEKKNEFQFIAKAMNQMASDLKEFHIKMAQMGKMAAIGELAGGVAHEINNPLTGILGNVQILMKKYAPETEESELLKKMERASLRCRNIVSDLLDFSRKEEQEKSDQDMNKVLEDTFSFCETEILSKNIELIKNYSSNLPAIKAAPRSLQQAFLNIISNAIQSMPEGGRLSVTTDLLRKNSIKYVRVDIKDTGIGFGEETAAHMFDPFFTTREVGEGTGLGLSLTYRIIKNHKGELKAHSPGPGKGALLTAIFQV